MRHLTTAVLSLALLGASAAHAAPLDPAGAEALMRKSGCFKCHALDKKKDGPPYKELAAKFKGKADAEAKIFDRLSKGTTVKIEGKDEEHDPLKTQDPDEIKSVVKWVLSQ